MTIIIIQHITLTNIKIILINFNKNNQITSDKNKTRPLIKLNKKKEILTIKNLKNK